MKSPFIQEPFLFISTADVSQLSRLTSERKLSLRYVSTLLDEWISLIQVTVR